MIRTLLEKVPRASVGVLGFWLPAERRRRLERYLRGWEQHQKLDRADAVMNRPVWFGVYPRSAPAMREHVAATLTGFVRKAAGGA